MYLQKKRFFSALTALALTLALCLQLCPAARALTTEEFSALLEKYYLNQPISETVLQQETVEKMVETLGDPYTAYLSPEQYTALLASMRDKELVGVGITVSQGTDGLLITSVIDASPAQEAGLRAGDCILSVDGALCAEQPIDVAITWIQGVADSTVSLGVRHADGSTQAYTLRRRALTVPRTSVHPEGENIGYIDCNAFGPETLGHFLTGMDAVPAADVWVVDLRSNPGGDFEAVTDTLGLFLGGGPMVYLREKNQLYFAYQSKQERKTILPAIILTGPYTASAAELFSSVMRDRDNALIIGEVTYGKGVGQRIIDRKVEPALFDEDAAKITSFRYFTTEGNTPDQIGVIPHLLLDAKLAPGVARLLCVQPRGANDSRRILRLNLAKWRWYLDFDVCLQAENRTAFRALLEALPPKTPLFWERGGQSIPTTPEELAQSAQLSDFRPRRFPDVADSPFATELNTLRTYDILRGNEQGEYHPADSLSRAELCALLSQAFSLSTACSGDARFFADVPEDAWYCGAVEAVTRLGLVQGTGAGCFSPLAPVSHQELATILGRLGARINLLFSVQLEKQAAPYPKVPSAYADWAAPYLWLLSYSQTNILGYPINLLYDTPENLDPTQPASRAQAGALLCRLLQHFSLISQTG